MPAPGELKHFANGKVGKWDGTGWESVDPQTVDPSVMHDPSAPTGKESSNFLKDMVGSRGAMSMAGGMGAGMLAAPYTAGMSIPLTMGVEALSGLLGGGTGALTARTARHYMDQPQDMSLEGDLGTGAIEGALTATGGSMMKAAGKAQEFVGGAVGPWGRRLALELPLAAVGHATGHPVLGGVGAGVGEAMLNPKLMPAAEQKVGEALRPGSIRDFLGGMFDRSGGGAAAPAVDPIDPATLARLQKQGYAPEMIDKIRARMGPSATGGRIPTPPTLGPSNAPPQAPNAAMEAIRGLGGKIKQGWNAVDQYMTPEPPPQMGTLGGRQVPAAAVERNVNATNLVEGGMDPSDAASEVGMPHMGISEVQHITPKTFPFMRSQETVVQDALKALRPQPIVDLEGRVLGMAEPEPRFQRSPSPMSAPRPEGPWNGNTPAGGNAPLAWSDQMVDLGNGSTVPSGMGGTNGVPHPASGLSRDAIEALKAEAMRRHMAAAGDVVPGSLIPKK